MRFCGECGGPLTVVCPKCEFHNQPAARSCGGCGVALPNVPVPYGSTVSTGTPDLGSGVSPEPGTERRQLTVLFCDLAGSTRLAEQLDPEDLREVVREYQGAAWQVIQVIEGHVAQYLGDGVLVYFGYPQAHEDDAQRAVRAGLGIVEAVAKLKPQMQKTWGIELAVRVGIHTGPVVAGSVGNEARRQELAVGPTPNVAARVQDAAQPNTVVLSGATRELVKGFFALEFLGPRRIKGLARAVDLYRAVGESGVHSRFEVALRRGLTPLVGRNEELGLLTECFRRSQEGRGQVVLISGEAGIGKSRLVHALRQRIAYDVEAWWVCRCSPWTQASALYPLIELVSKLFGLEAGDTGPQKSKKIEAQVKRLDLPAPQVVPLVAEFLSLPQSESYPPLSLSPEQRKNKSLEILVDFLLHLARERPVVLVMEDLHWVDPSTREFLDLLLLQVPAARILALFTFRPSFRPSWDAWSSLTHLRLERMSDREVTRMVKALAHGKALPVEVVRHLAEKTDGVPLFVEELTTTVLESDVLRETETGYELTEDQPLVAIPTTLQDSLMARLDRLGAAKEVAQLGAILGREFSQDMLQAVCTLAPAQLEEGLDELFEAGLVSRRGFSAQAVYRFKHALVQDTAYQSLLKSVRQDIHRRIADTLVQRFVPLAETQPELVAHHYSEGQCLEAAVEYWQRAGKRALERSAIVEATTHLKKGLALVPSLSPGEKRERLELALQTTLGGALTTIRGFSAPEVEQAYRRAFEICQRIDEAPELFWVLRGLWAFHSTRADYDKASELGARLLELADVRQDPAGRLSAYHAVGAPLFMRGEFAAAYQQLEPGLDLDPTQSDEPYASHIGLDLSLAVRLWAAASLWFLGYPERASKLSEDTLQRARRISQPYSLAYGLNYAAHLSYYRRDYKSVLKHARELKVLVREQRFMWGPRLFLVWAQARADEVRGAQWEEEAAREEIRRGRSELERYLRVGGRNLASQLLLMLAETATWRRQLEAARGFLEESVAIMAQGGERYYEAEVERFGGELLLLDRARADLPSRQLEAESSFENALAIARRQEAKSLELRAALSLARLRAEQGKRKEARALVAEVYDWFSEGFKYPDLRQAKDWLDRLS